MELPDCALTGNHDWDPSYLAMLFDQDFYEFTELWKSNVTDGEIVTALTDSGIYSPIVEDVSMEDEVLYKVVDQIETE